MKHVILALSVLFACESLVGHEKSEFKTAKEVEIGSSNAFELSKTKNAVLKTPDGGFLILKLLKTGNKEGEKSSRESCSISWTLVSAKGAQSGKEDAFIKYEVTKKGADGSRTVEAVDGSDRIEIGGLSFGWSRGSGILVYIYPEAGTEYTTIKVEQDGETDS